jgi:cytoskeleton protein RodZ
MNVPSSSRDSAENRMNDSTDHSANGGVRTDTVSSSMMSGPSVGQQLRAGRERAGLSVDDAARALKLSNRQVESLEQDDWASLPGKTMIRGFVRNYARLVGLDGRELMAALEGMAMPKSPELRGAEGTPVSMPKEGKSDRKDVLRVLAGLLVLALALVAYFFLPADMWQSTVQAIKDASQSNEAVVDTVADTPPVGPETPAPVAQVESVTPEQPVVVPEPASVSEPVIQRTEGLAAEVQTPVTNVLKFGFTQPSWVEVRDRNGQIIFSQKNPAGSQRDVQGQPPFSVVIGNAAHVTLHYKGNAVDLSKRSKDDVARLTIE